MRRTLSARLVLQATFALVAAILLAVCATYGAYTFQRWRAAEKVEATVAVSRDLFDAMQNVRLQRGVIAAAIEGPDESVSAPIRRQLAQAQVEISSALAAALNRLDRTGDGAVLAARLRAEQARFLAARRVAESQMTMTGPQALADADAWIAANDRFVNTMAGVSSEMASLVHRQDGLLGRMVSISRLAWSARAAAGDTWIILHRALEQNRPLTPGENGALAQMAGRVQGSWDMVEGLGQLSDTPQPLKAAIARADRLFFHTAQARVAALEADLNAGRPTGPTGRAWLSDGGASLVSLIQVGIVAFDQARANARAEAISAERRFYLALALMLVVIGCGWAASLQMIRRYVRPMDEVADAMRGLAAGDLEAEIPCQGRGDEIGALAQALGVFRENALAKARMEGELRRAEVERQAAEAASQLKSQFLANMSHEIRTPLNGVLGMVQAMEREEATPAQRDRLRIIRDSGETLLQVLGDVLDYSKIEAGKLELNPEPFDLGEVARRACAIFADTAAAKGLQFGCQVEPAAEGMWHGDPARVRQMMMNLLSNAVKFTSSGRVAVEVRRLAGGLGILVHDTGAGIDRAQLPRLFSKFSQADGSVTRQFGGTGLGLAICRELAALMGGHVDVDSTPGEGSTFTLYLPLERLGDVPVMTHEDAAPSPPAPEAAERPLRILAAEDNAINQKVLAALMEPVGAELTLVASGQEAIEVWRTGAWDMILMDIQMPGMSGMEATLQIRAAEAAEGRARTPIVAVSANAMQHQMDEYRAAGMELHVSKPIQAQALYLAVQAAVDLRQAQDPPTALAG